MAPKTKAGLATTKIDRIHVNGQRQNNFRRARRLHDRVVPVQRWQLILNPIELTNEGRRGLDKLVVQKLVWRKRRDSLQDTRSLAAKQHSDVDLVLGQVLRTAPECRVALGRYPTAL